MLYTKTALISLVLAGTGAVLGGCASISKSDCEAANWSDNGYRDGANGESRSILADYANECAGHGLGIDRDAYLAAYETGLNEFCAPGRAFTQGRSGAELPNVCADRPDYIANYDLGAAQYCTSDNGYERGLSGNESSQACVGPQYEGYRGGYYDGRAKYDANQERLRLNKVKHDRLRDDVHEIEREMGSVGRQLRTGLLSENEIYRLERKLRRLEDRLSKKIEILRVFERGD